MKSLHERASLPTSVVNYRKKVWNSIKGQGFSNYNSIARAEFRAAFGSEVRNAIISHMVNSVDGLVVCKHCVGEKYLSGLIEKQGQELRCSYCEETSNCITVAQLAKHVETGILEHFERTPENPDDWEEMRMRHFGESWDRAGEPILELIKDVVEIENDLADDIHSCLAPVYTKHDDISGEQDFDLESHYETKQITDDRWKGRWSNFEDTLKTEARYFSQAGLEILNDIFDNVRNLRTRDGNQPIVETRPGNIISAFYRARVFQSDRQLELALKNPVWELGPPPASKVVSGGRMNAPGISVFYGATTEKLALAEVRPPVGSKVLIGKFNIISRLRLLDLTALKNVKISGSPFDPTYKILLEKIAFLKTLSDRMAKAVLPDHQQMEYLPTQAVADYLSSRTDLSLHGILFPSAQSKDEGVNVMLFHKSSMVRDEDLTDDTNIQVRLREDDDDDPDYPYRIIETVDPNVPVQKPTTMLSEFFRYKEDGRNLNMRTSTLALDKSSLSVNHISEVRYESQKFAVEISRQAKTEPLNNPFVDF